jgi:hypothetical protein
MERPVHTWASNPEAPTVTAASPITTMRKKLTPCIRKTARDRYHVTSTGDLSDDQATEVIRFLTTALTADIVGQLDSVSQDSSREIPAPGLGENTGGTVS